MKKTKLFTLLLFLAAVFAIPALSKEVRADEPENGWVEEEGERKYYKDGLAVTGWQFIDDNWYYFYPDAPMAREVWQDDSKGHCYLKTDGTAARNGWLEVAGEWYYFDSSCHARSNTWVRDSAGWCYLGSDGAALHEEWTYYKEDWYYLKDDCRMAAGEWADDSGGKCYLMAGGDAAKDKWVQHGGKWYYLNNNYHMLRSAWAKDTGGWWCYCQEDGTAVRKKWIQSGGEWYFIKDNYRMASKEWAKDSKGWCWMEANGKIARNKWIQYGGRSYYLKSNGYMASEEELMEVKASGYTSSTNWLILVNRATHRTAIFNRSGSQWKLYKYLLCSDGAASTPTVEGQFTVGGKQLYFGTSSYRCWYATQFYGDYLFHSGLYYPGSSPSQPQDLRMGMALSHGCVRLELSEAKWIYDNIPGGTKVVVFH